MENTYPTGETLAAAQQKFETMIRAGVFRPVERFVCRDADREDRIAEGLAFGWRWYSQQVALGNDPDVALAVHVVRLRTVDRSRRFLSGDRARWRDDVYQQQGRRIELRRLDAVPDRDDDDDDRHDQDPAVGLARMGVADPTTNVLSAIDLGDWLGTLADSDRELLKMRAAGFGLAEIGRVTGRSTVGAFRRTRLLGFELAERAGVEITSKPSAIRTHRVVAEP
jgi:hypothetical protein